MSKKNSHLSEVPLWARTGHRKPETRREFLASGMIKMMATISLPGWAQLLNSAHAFGAECNPGIPSTMAAFMTFHLSGGASLGSNFLATSKDRQPLKSYDIMGLGNGSVPIELDFGNVPFAGRQVATDPESLLSKLLLGIRSGADDIVRAKTACIGIPVRTRDDASDNSLDITGLVALAGRTGSILPNIGQRPTPSGVGLTPAEYSPPPKMIVNNYADIVGAVGYTAGIAGLDVNQKRRVASLVARLTQSQVQKMSTDPTSVSVKNLIECAGIDSKALVSEKGDLVDPLKNPSFMTAWDNPNAQKTITNVFGLPEIVKAQGAAIYNCLMGYAGVTNLHVGGFDYHDNTRSVGNSCDLRAGELIGKTLAAAAALNKKCFIYVTTDGACSSEKSEDRQSPWTSDRGIAGLVLLFAYDPAGRPKTTDFQIGNFTEGQAVDESVITANTRPAACVAFANYLQFNGRLDLYESLKIRSVDLATLKSGKLIKFV